MRPLLNMTRLGCGLGIHDLAITKQVICPIGRTTIALHMRKKRVGSTGDPEQARGMAEVINCTTSDHYTDDSPS